ncbi:MAG TPA: hypothetical protein PKI03_32100, partial [Pseudomonadota bacterium]|nr:hypothetical protein [Pseudomonadota bacterium]
VVSWGDSRIGKSHYARKLVLDVMTTRKPSGERYFFIQANSSISARRVLESIFLQLVDALQQTGTVPEDLVRTWERMERPTSTSSVSVVVSDSTPTKFGPEANALAVKGGFGQDGTHSEGKTSAFTFGALHDMELIRAIAAGLDRLASLQPKRALLLIDDVDLIRSGGEGNRARDEILKLLRDVLDLAQSKPIFLLTTRKLPKDREKEESVFVSLLPLRDVDLKAIYQRHIAYFLSGAEVFSAATLAWLIQHAAQRVGVFLHQCRALYDFAWYRDCQAPLGEEIRQEWLHHEWDELLSDEEAGAFARDVQAHVDAHSDTGAGRDGRAGKVVPLLSLDRAVEDTALIHSWLRMRGDGRYEVAPALIDFLRGR